MDVFHRTSLASGTEDAGSFEPAGICELAAQLWERKRDLGDLSVRMTHAGYLKLYTMSRPTLPYDVVLIDEAQDRNPAIASIGRMQRHRRHSIHDREGHEGPPPVAAGARGAGAAGRAVRVHHPGQTAFRMNFSARTSSVGRDPPSSDCVPSESVDGLH